MRLEKVMLARGICDPESMSGTQSTFYDGQRPEFYDLYLVNGDIYIVRNGNVAVAMTAGTVYIRGEEGAKKAAELAKRFPRRAPESQT